MEFLNWLEQKGILDISQIRTSQLMDYYDYLSSRPSKNQETTLSEKTTFEHLRNIQKLFTMLQKQGVVKANPYGGLKIKTPQLAKERIILSQEEIKQLYEVTESAQERAILGLAYGCGLRSSELSKCNVEDVKLKAKILIVPNGKGLKKRVVPMSKGVVKDLADYYYEERENLKMERDYRPGLKAFMLHDQGGRMQAWTYNKYLKRMIERTESYSMKIKKITIHSLRHSIASHLIQQGVEVENVRLFLGHSQLETTQIYTHINQEQLSKLMEDVEQKKESEIPIDSIGEKDDTKKLPP